MDIHIQLDESQQQPKIVIYTREITPEITQLIDRLSSPATLNGFEGSQVYPLSLTEIVRIFTDGQKVYAENRAKKRFLVKERLFALEEQLKGSGFIRISHSEIANMKQVHSLDLSLTGNITLVFQNGVTTFVSRRQMKNIKTYLHI